MRHLKGCKIRNQLRKGIIPGVRGSQDVLWDVKQFIVRAVRKDPCTHLFSVQGEFLKSPLPTGLLLPCRPDSFTSVAEITIEKVNLPSPPFIYLFFCPENEKVRNT